MPSLPTVDPGGNAWTASSGRTSGWSRVTAWIYRPIDEQRFVGDTLSILASRFRRKITSVERFLGPPSTSGIDYRQLRKRQACPVLPLHLASFREEKSLTLLIDGHPYWQMFEFGAFTYKGRTIPLCWPSSYSGRQIFVTPDQECYDYLSAYMGGIEVQQRPISFKEETSETGGMAFRLRTELPTGEDLEVCVNARGKALSVDRWMVPYDNHVLDKVMILGSIKGKGWLGDAGTSWITIDGVRHGFGRALGLVPMLMAGDMHVVFGGPVSYDRHARCTGDSAFSIVNSANGTQLDFAVCRANGRVTFRNRGPLHETVVETEPVDDASEIRGIRNVVPGQEAVSVRFNPGLPDMRYAFKDAFVGRFGLSAGECSGIITGAVRAKHLGDFVIFDFVPERTRVARRRTMKMTVQFDSDDSYHVVSQMFGV